MRESRADCGAALSFCMYLLRSCLRVDCLLVSGWFCEGIGGFRLPRGCAGVGLLGGAWRLPVSGRVCVSWLREDPQKQASRQRAGGAPPPLGRAPGLLAFASEGSRRTGVVCLVSPGRHSVVCWGCALWHVNVSLCTVLCVPYQWGLVRSRWRGRGCNA